LVPLDCELHGIEVTDQVYQFPRISAVNKCKKQLRVGDTIFPKCVISKYAFNVYGRTFGFSRKCTNAEVTIVNIASKNLSLDLIIVGMCTIKV